MTHHCKEFSRSSLLRQGIAEAGRGLPAIEQGMPLPAGTGLDRRSFISKTLGAALTVYGTTALGPRVFDSNIARAASAGSSDRVLISIFAPGGWDALSLLYPAGDPQYHKLRPDLALAADAGIAFKSDQRLHWHPSLKPLAQMHDKGKVTVFPAIGYTHPDQSHFTSRHYWEVGALDPQQGTGWLGRLLDVIGDDQNAMQGLSLDDSLLPSLATAKVPVATLSSPTGYSFESQNVWDVPGNLLPDAIGTLGNLKVATDPFLTQASTTAGESDQLRRQLSRFIGHDGQAHYNTKVKYPDNSDFSTKLAGLAALLHAGFPIRAVALQAPGEYDTHSDESGPLAQSLTEIAGALAAFQADLEQRRLAGRVTTMLWSEFGRRAAQNDSNGTDHGAAGVGFLIGDNLKHSMVGEFPGLGHGGLDRDGNLKETVDFRAVYASLAEEWFNVDAEKILPDAKKMPRLQLV